MTDPRLEDHVVGLELQLVELVEQEQRAEVQGRADDAARLEREIQALQLELAETVEHLTLADADETFPTDARPEVQANSAKELADRT